MKHERFFSYFIAERRNKSSEPSRAQVHAPGGQVQEATLHQECNAAQGYHYVVYRSGEDFAVSFTCRSRLNLVVGTAQVYNNDTNKFVGKPKLFRYWKNPSA